MPRFAVMTFMFKHWWQGGRVSMESTFAAFAAAGAQGIEPFHVDFVEDPALLPRYRRAVADSGMQTPAVDVMCNLVYADAAQKRKGRDDLRRGLDVCKDVGAQVAHVAGHYLVEGVTPADGRKMIAQGLCEAVDIARSYGLTLAIEDFCPSPRLVCSAADCLEVMRLSGGLVKFVFDTGNFIAVGERAEEQFDALAGHTCHCHFKDFVGQPGGGYRGCVLGKGDINNAAVAAKLNARGFDGWVALEAQDRQDAPPDAVVREELPLLKSYFNR